MYFMRKMYFLCAMNFMRKVLPLYLNQIKILQEKKTIQEQNLWA